MIFAIFQLPFEGFFGFRILKDIGIFRISGWSNPCGGATDATVCFAKKWKTRKTRQQSSNYQDKSLSIELFKPRGFPLK